MIACLKVIISSPISFSYETQLFSELFPNIEEKAPSWKGMPPFTVLLLQYKRHFRKSPTWLSFSICATKRGKRWTSVESFSVLTCLTIDRSSTSPSYAIGKIEVSLTEVWHSADITAARSRLLDVLKFASWISC